MKTMLHTLGAIVGVAVIGLLIFSAAFGARWIGIEWRGFFGERSMAVERRIYEQSPSFVQSRTYDLTRYRVQWSAATEETGRKAIENLVRIQMVNLDPAAVNDPDLSAWLRWVNRGGSTGVPFQE